MEENKIQCDRCGELFEVKEAVFGQIERDGLKVKYFSCPACGVKYHILTSNSKMESLIKKREIVETKIRLSFSKKLPEKTIRKYERELDEIRKQQVALSEELKVLGEEILRSEEKV